MASWGGEVVGRGLGVGGGGGGGTTSSSSVFDGVIQNLNSVDATKLVVSFR